MIGLGTALAATGRTEEGKARLLEGQALVNHTDEQRETLQRVVTFYETWGEPEEASLYRAQLEAMASTQE